MVVQKGSCEAPFAESSSFTWVRYGLMDVPHDGGGVYAANECGRAEHRQPCAEPTPRSPLPATARHVPWRRLGGETRQPVFRRLTVGLSPQLWSHPQRDGALPLMPKVVALKNPI